MNRTLAIDERETINLALNGDSEAFETLFIRYRKRVFAICYRMVRDRELAEDLLQDTFLLAYRRLSTFRQESRFSTWLHRVAVNVCFMYMRKRATIAPQTSLDEPVADESDRAHDHIGRADQRLDRAVDRVAIERAVAFLPPGYRLIFVLHDVEGYEHHEIAEILGCTMGNTKSQLHKARLRLRQLLAKQANTAQLAEAA